MATHRFLARKKSTLSRRSEPESLSGLSATPSDQKPRDIKARPYTNVRYKDLLATLGIFTGEFELGITIGSNRLCEQLLDGEITTPPDSLFRDDLFTSTYQAVEDRNEARIVRDILPMLVPSAENLAIYGAAELKALIESINESWNNSIPLTEPRPQPDYSVGFRRNTFTTNQLKKLFLTLAISLPATIPYLMATDNMYFPFLAYEVKCGAAALDIADWQNAHSMTLAVRSLVTFIYPCKAPTRATPKTHRIWRKAEVDGVAYKFTRNVYSTWMLSHLERIRSALDDLLNPPNPQLPDRFGLSQDLETYHLSQSLVESESFVKQSSQVRAGEAKDFTPDTSFSGAQGISKRSDKKRR